jgi:hypothetical protein
MRPGGGGGGGGGELPTLRGGGGEGTSLLFFLHFTDADDAHLFSTTVSYRGGTRDDVPFANVDETKRA